MVWDGNKLVWLFAWVEVFRDGFAQVDEEYNARISIQIFESEVVLLEESMDSRKKEMDDGFFANRR